MKISYCVTVHNETDTLVKLLDVLVKQLMKHPEDEILIQDDFSDNQETLDIINKYKSLKGIVYYKHRLNNDYGSFKNEFIKRASGNYIFAIDADEYPQPLLMGHIHNIIESNAGIECFVIARLNNFKGVTMEHAKSWNWRLTPSTSIINEKIIDTTSLEYKYLKENGYILEELEIC